ncbi:MAG: CDP-alcohol phosphatidyltransferase family protein [Fibrobacteria bacterium]
MTFPHKRMDKEIFIVRLNPVCWLTLAGLAIDLSAVFLFIDLPRLEAGSSFQPRGNEGDASPRFFLAIGLMYLGMLTDAFDGILARRYRLDGEFGRYLDGFVDVFNYLILPNLALWRLGFHGPYAAIIMLILVGAGILRLSKFNQIGNIQVEGSSKFLGLPVFWTQLALAPLYLMFAFLPASVFHLGAGTLWIAMSFAFLYNRPFFKPKNPWLIAGITLSLSALGFAGYALGLHP